MKCPYCRQNNNKVIDSRLSKDGDAIRRRRECINCERRFTTYEYIEDIPIMIIKKDKRREVFNRDKVRTGLLKACEKREISMNDLESFMSELERDLRESEAKEIPSTIIGEKMMAMLHKLDKVAYVRFASVYRDFKDVTDFENELKTLK